MRVDRGAWNVGRVVILALVLISIGGRAITADPPAQLEWLSPDALLPITASSAARVKLVGIRGAAEVEEMKWSPDDALLGLRSSGGLAIYRLDTAKGVRLAKERVLCADRPPLSFAFLKGEDSVITSDGSKTLTVWDVRSGWSKQEVKNAPSGLAIVAMSPAEPFLAAATAEGKLCIWRGAAFEESPRVVDDHKEGTAGITIDSKGKWAVTWAQWNTVHVWNLAEATREHSVELGEEKSFRSVGPAVLTPDGKSLWVGYMGTVRRWIYPAEVLIDDFSRSLIPRSVDFIHPEGKICVAREEQGAGIYSVADGKLIRKLPETKDPGPAAYQPSKGKMLAIASEGKVSIFDARTAGRACFEDLGNPCRIAAASPDGAWFVYGADWQRLEIADLKKGGKGAKLASDANTEFTRIAIDPRARVLAGITGWYTGPGAVMSGKRTHQLSLWQFEGKRLKKSSAFEKEATEAGSVAFSPDGQWLAVGSMWQEPPVVKLLSLKAGKAMAPVRLPLGRSGSSMVECLAFDSKSKLVAAVVESLNRVIVIDIERGKTAFDLPLPGTYASANQVAFSPSGAVIAVDTYATVLLFDAQSRQLRSALKPQQGSCEQFAFSPDGSILAATVYRSVGESGYSDLALFDAAGGSTLSTLSAHLGRTNGISFLGDGKMIATAGQDGSVRLWGIKKQAEPAEK
jgi:WD40 repeat protein